MFRVKVHRKVDRALDKLPANAKKRVKELLIVLENDSLSLSYDVKRIKSTTDWYRVRLGDYRVVYWVDEEKKEKWAFIG